MRRWNCGTFVSSTCRRADALLLAVVNFWLLGSMRVVVAEGSGLHHSTRGRHPHSILIPSYPTKHTYDDCGSNRVDITRRMASRTLNNICLKV
ncbi:hypothetical protein GGS26DRAFT_381047 [Hypomontagnella submonticulosa]|nr:hypothetical protein GGS26DRAFT_381047 [Hypomontagnella submonticulosa]